MNEKESRIPACRMTRSPGESRAHGSTVPSLAQWVPAFAGTAVGFLHTRRQAADLTVFISGQTLGSRRGRVSKGALLGAWLKMLPPPPRKRRSRATTPADQIISGQPLTCGLARWRWLLRCRARPARTGRRLAGWRALWLPLCARRRRRTARSFPAPPP
jgi:hypothetical protein